MDDKKLDNKPEPEKPENEEIRYDRFLWNQGDSMDFSSDIPKKSDRETSKKPDKPKEK